MIDKTADGHRHAAEIFIGQEDMLMTINAYHQFITCDIVCTGYGTWAFSSGYLGSEDKPELALIYSFVNGVLKAFGERPVAKVYTRKHLKGLFLDANRRLTKLEGRKVFVLKATSKFGEIIEGLECAETGKRFLHSNWLRAAKKKPDTLESRIEDLEARAASLEQQAARIRNKDIPALKADFYDWSKAT